MLKTFMSRKTNQIPSEDAAPPIELLELPGKAPSKQTRKKVKETLATSGKEKKAIDVNQARRALYEALGAEDKKNRHNTYAAYGVQVFPVELGHDPEYKEYLKKHHPEKYLTMRHFISQLRKMTKPDKENSESYREKYPDGVPMKDFERIVNSELGDRSGEYQELLHKLERGLLTSCAYVKSSKETPDRQLRILDDIREEAGVFYRNFIKAYFSPENQKQFEESREVLNGTLAELILLAFSAKDPRIAQEAKRKALLTYDLQSLKAMERGRGDLKRYWESLKESGFFYTFPNGKQVVDVYLVSEHDPNNDRKCTNAYFTQEKPKTVNENIKIQALKMRACEVPEKNPKGNEKKRVVYFYYDDRPKDPHSELMKMMEKDTRNPQKAIEDKNGTITVCENLNDIVKVLEKRRACLMEQGCIIDEYGWEVSVDGRDYKKIGNKRPGSSKNFQIIKVQEKIIFPPILDENGLEIKKEHEAILEHMFYNAEMYANAKFQIGVAHDQYQVNRVHEGSLLRLLVPNRPGLYEYDQLHEQLECNKRIIRNNLGWTEEDVKKFEEKFRAEHEMK